MAEKKQKRKLFCISCQRLKVEDEFYRSQNIEKYPPDGRIDECKDCVSKLIDCWRPETYMPVLEKLDIPYIKAEWDATLSKTCQMPVEDFSAKGVLGRYVSKMKLNQWKGRRFADSAAIQRDIDADIASKLRDRGVPEEEIAETLKKLAEREVPMPAAFKERVAARRSQPALEIPLDVVAEIPALAAMTSTPLKKKTLDKSEQSNAIENLNPQDEYEYVEPLPKQVLALYQTESAQPPLFSPIGPEEIDERQEEIEELGLTQDDVTYLSLKWGKSYMPKEWVTMEQLYSDMCESYDIQTAGHKDTLKLICKSSLKANQLIDGGDLEGYQKISRVYDTLMKSGNFTAAQNKYAQGGFIDSIGEFVAMCESKGFIPKYYTDGPQDKVDRTLEDLQQYTKRLVEEEMGLGQQIESAAKALIEARKNEFIVADDNDVDEEQLAEERLFSDGNLSDRDIIDFKRREAMLEEDGEAYLQSLMEASAEYDNGYYEDDY